MGFESILAPLRDRLNYAGRTCAAPSKSRPRPTDRAPVPVFGEVCSERGSRCETRSRSALPTPRRAMNSGLQPRRTGESDRHRLELLMSTSAADPQPPRTTVRVNGVELGVE